MDLPDFFRLVRGEACLDPRLNKALEVRSHLPCWASYKHHELWENIVREGVKPVWSRPFDRQNQLPSNHGSAHRALNVLVNNIRRGQDANRYLVLDIVIDLACPFGWTESPACYWVTGGAIKHIHTHSSPEWPHRQPGSASEPFDGKAWCDAHVAVEHDVDTRLAEADLSLRTAMTAVIGPDACNEELFSVWFTQGKALGLCWDTRNLTVTMPPEKISKARNRIYEMLSKTSPTRSALQKLLGSLRYVSTCVRAATLFFQRVAEVPLALAAFVSSLDVRMILSDFWLFFSLHASTVFRSSDLLPSKCLPSTSKWTLAISGCACCSQQHANSFRFNLIRKNEIFFGKVNAALIPFVSTSVSS